MAMKSIPIPRGLLGYSERKSCVHLLGFEAETKVPEKMDNAWYSWTLVLQHNSFNKVSNN